MMILSHVTMKNESGDFEEVPVEAMKGATATEQRGPKYCIDVVLADGRKFWLPCALKTIQDIIDEQSE